MNKISIPYPVIVEGKYDKIKLDSIIDTTVLATDGFGVFKSDEKKALFRALACQDKVIVLTDPDGAGLSIRAFLSQILPPDKIINLYVPERAGKEKRKTEPSKQGLLGVEGIDADTLRALFEPLCGDLLQKAPKEKITKSDLYSDGLSGSPGSAVKRREFCARAGLPQNISANALVDIVNLLYGRERYKKLL